VIRDAGIAASGEVSDSDPLQAIEDALRTFAPDELEVVSSGSSSICAQSGPFRGSG
jgi:hypothetical protein